MKNTLAVILAILLIIVFVICPLLSFSQDIELKELTPAQYDSLGIQLDIKVIPGPSFTAFEYTNHNIDLPKVRQALEEHAYKNAYATMAITNYYLTNKPHKRKAILKRQEEFEAYMQRKFLYLEQFTMGSLTKEEYRWLCENEDKIFELKK